MASLSPLSPPSENSSGSSSPNVLHTPLMSDLASDSSSPITSSASSGKRKPSRRANTAERRATHNAVERQRRETLNGRFLDLAALLPGLSQIRRPSKSAIVNSSIAYIHGSRRHRLIAARELRLLKQETDALRRELNEWRDRSTLPRVEEPVRGDCFNLVLSGEAEVVVPANHEDDELLDNDDGDDDLCHTAGTTTSSGDDVDDLSHAAAVSLNSPSSVLNHTPPRSESVSNGPQPHPVMIQMFNGRQLPVGPPQQPVHHNIRNGPMIASQPASVSSENPALASVYDAFMLNQNVAQYDFGSAHFGSNQLPPHIIAQLATEMGSKVGPGWYNNVVGQHSRPSSSGEASPGNSFYMTNGNYTRHGYNDDGSGCGRERTVSIGSTNRGSPIGNYELAGGPGLNGVPRWIGNNSLNDGNIGLGSGAVPAYAMMM